jgi:hypothetical protein
VQCGCLLLRLKLHCFSPVLQSAQQACQADYQYNDELQKIFMSSNLIGGMFQRIEKMRKYAFGSVAVFGEDNSNVISGIWVWRGQDLIFPVRFWCR